MSATVTRVNKWLDTRDVPIPKNLTDTDTDTRNLSSTDTDTDTRNLSSTDTDTDTWNFTDTDTDTDTDTWISDKKCIFKIFFKKIYFFSFKLIN